MEESKDCDIDGSSLTICHRPAPPVIIFKWSFARGLSLRMIICKRPDYHLQEAGPFQWSFARDRSLQMIICKRPSPSDDHLKEARPSGWSFARGWSLRIIICKRSAPPNDHLQEAGPSGSSCASSAFHQYMNHACCPGMWQWKSLCLQGDTSESFKNFLVVKTIDGRRICMFIFAPLLTLMTFLGDKKW